MSNFTIPELRDALFDETGLLLNVEIRDIGEPPVAVLVASYEGVDLLHVHKMETIKEVLANVPLYVHVEEETFTQRVSLAKLLQSNPTLIGELQNEDPVIAEQIRILRKQMQPSNDPLVMTQNLRALAAQLLLNDQDINELALQRMQNKLT